MNQECLNGIEKQIEKILQENTKILPKSWIKWLAYYFPNAKIRKKCWSELGVIMGEETYSNIGMIVVMGKKAKVYIGRRVSIAPNVIFVADSVPNNSRVLQQMPAVLPMIKEKDIYVEDDVWIGANVTILPGVRIGACSIIGAGSVVTKDVEAYGVYVGVPATKIRDIREG